MITLRHTLGLAVDEPFVGVYGPLTAVFAWRLQAALCTQRPLCQQPVGCWLHGPFVALSNSCFHLDASDSAVCNAPEASSIRRAC